MRSCHFSFFFFNDTATTEIYTLSLHDALPISPRKSAKRLDFPEPFAPIRPILSPGLSETSAASSSVFAPRDRKSTRLNSSHQIISYAVFCLKKKKNHTNQSPYRYCSSPRIVST